MGNIKKVTLIGPQKKFLVGTIAKELTVHHYDVRRLEADSTRIGEGVDEDTIFFIYLEGEIDQSMLRKVDELVDQHDIKVYLFGEANDIREATTILPEYKQAGTFLRPINMKVVLNMLEDLQEKEAGAEKRKKILVVDDNGTMLRTIKTWLSGRYSVSMANSGAQAIAFLARNPVDLILLDYEMPVIGGPQVLKMLRAEPELQDIPVMFLTAKGDRESVLEVVNLHPEKYLLKTMSSAEIIANIDEFFAGREE